MCYFNAVVFLISFSFCFSVQQCNQFLNVDLYTATRLNILLVLTIVVCEIFRVLQIQNHIIYKQSSLIYGCRSRNECGDVSRNRGKRSRIERIVSYHSVMIHDVVRHVEEKNTVGPEVLVKSDEWEELTQKGRGSSHRDKKDKRKTPESRGGRCGDQRAESEANSLG